jgi:hypothetical protein
MTTYAILGATGQTGSEIVKALLPTSAHLNIYARSQARLEAQFPHISTAPNVALFIGDLSDTPSSPLASPMPMLSSPQLLRTGTSPAALSPNVPRWPSSTHSSRGGY